MLSDIEIAQQCRMKNISEIAAALKIPEDLVEPYGRYKAKIDYSALETKGKKGKLVLAILHDMDFVAEYFQRVIVMAHGQILADGRGDEVFSQKEILEKACLNPPYVSQLCSRLGYSGIYLTVEEFLKETT